MRNKLHKALVAVRENAVAYTTNGVESDDFYSDVGICNNINNTRDIDLYTNIDDIYDLLYEAFAVWPKFSGDLDYPVPHKYSGSAGYYRNTNKWDITTQYGKDRMELLEFMIDYFAEEKA